MSKKAIVLVVQVLVAVAIIAGFYAMLFAGYYRYNRETWTIKSVNAGFMIVTNTHGEESLIRNPLVGMKVGMKVRASGFGLTELPYAESVISSETTLP